METWLIDARTFAKKPTGIGTYAFREIRHWLATGELKPSNCVLVCDVKDSAAIRELEAKGCRVMAYGKPIYNSIGVIGYNQFVKRVIAEVKPDVFWQPNNLQPFRPKGVKRVIVTMHDVFGLKEWSWRYALWHIHYWLNFGRTLRNATEIWYNSEQTKREVEAMAKGRVPSVSRITHPRSDVPKRETIAPYQHVRPFFLYVGNIEIRKGADLLIAAYQQYRAAALEKGGKPYDLVFAGIEKNIQVPRTDGITVLGYVDDATKFSLMTFCAALIVPSRAEGYGMQVAEASTLNIPCLAADLPVFREIPGTRTLFAPGSIPALADQLLSFSVRP